MNMELVLYAFGALLGFIIALGGWIASRFATQLDEATKALAALELKMAETCVTKVDLHGIMDQILERLKLIDGKLDRKADKD